MFIDNKYTKWYQQLINKSQNRIRDLNSYYEKHHIIPKCMGGSNKKENLVHLTAREHYIAHLLLTKMTNGKDKRNMYFSVWKFVYVTSKQSRYKLNNRQYENAKKLLSIASKEQNKERGNSYITEEILEKLRNKIPWNKGRKQSADHNAKISKSNKGKIFSETHKQNLRNGIRSSVDICKKNGLKWGGGGWNKGSQGTFLGKKHSELSCEKISLKNKGRKFINNGTENKSVKPNELIQYTQLGWKLGRLIY